MLWGCICRLREDFGTAETRRFDSSACTTINSSALLVTMFRRFFVCHSWRPESKGGLRVHSHLPKAHKELGKAIIRAGMDRGIDFRGPASTHRC